MIVGLGLVALASAIWIITGPEGAWRYVALTLYAGGGIVTVGAAARMTAQAGRQWLLAPLLGALILLPRALTWLARW